MKFSLLAALLAATCLLPGCLAVQEPVCQSNMLVPVSAVIGPRTAAVNQQVTYTLSYSLGNSCGAFSNLVTNSASDSARVRQVGINANYSGCSCTTTTTTAQTAYQFQPTKAGTYYLQFLTTDNKFITDTLTVR